MAEVVTEAAEEPLSPRRQGHDCGSEIRQAEHDYIYGQGFDSYRRFGMVVRCSCGLLYQLRRLTALRSAFPGRGAQNSRWWASQYWAQIRREYS